MAGRCGILFDKRSGADPEDTSSCILKDGHRGRHEFKDAKEIIWQWEFDHECNCGCEKGEPRDVCIFYNKKDQP